MSVPKQGNLYDELKALEPISLSFHTSQRTPLLEGKDDADGVYSASLIFAAGIQIKDKDETSGFRGGLMVKAPTFNDYVTDVALDLGFPSNKEWSGICVDHHPDHPSQRKYKLYWERVPTGLVLFNELKDHIPKSQWWRVVGSLVGDGQVDCTPDEVWDAFPELTDEKGSVWQKDFEINMSRYPIYTQLSSGINALCRIGNPLGALDTCLRFRNPLDAIVSKDCEEAKGMERTEEYNVFKNKPYAEVIGNRFVLVKIRTTGNIGVAGKIATSLSFQAKNLTVVVVNETNGECSIRGTFAKYAANKLNAAGFKAGGHPGYAGATAPVGNIEDFLDVIRKCR